MRRPYCSIIALSASVVLSACGSGGYSGAPSSPVTSSGGGTSSAFASDKNFFAARVEPNLGYCRTCHVPGGVADTDKGRRFQLSGNPTEDYDRVQTSWAVLGKGIEANRILLKASNTDPEPHSGGAPWPKGSAPYNDAKTLFTCWDNPAGCAALLAGLGGAGGTVPAQPPLLGDLAASGGRNYAAQFCASQPDSAPLPADPRELIAGDNLNNKKYSVWFNDPFEICMNETVLENQAQQNAILATQGQKPVYTGKRRPKTCGEWRTAVESGRKYIMSNPITGAVLSAQSLYNLVPYLGYQFPGDAEAANALLAKVAQERYGWPTHPYRNPFPMPGEDPNKTNGGSMQLPIALVQVKNDDGSWSGKMGATCFACHIGQIGTGEVVGSSAQRDGHAELYGGSPEGTFVSLNGSNTDTGLALWDIQLANNPLDPIGYGIPSPTGFNANLDTPGYMANRTRGTNAADQEIVNVLYARNVDTLDFRSPLLGPQVLGKLVPSAPLAGGDQNMPTWWWTHNKTRYLWVAFGSAGSARGNYFPSSTNPNDGHWSKHRESDYEDLDQWLNAVEAPPWPDGFCSNADGTPAPGDKPHCISRPLAEQGAILFHSKDLWAGDANADIPKPPVGNGSCASCHGAYSPRFISQPGFLPDPSLGGYSGLTVPQKIIGTDPAQTNLFTGGAASASQYGFPAPGLSFGELLSNSWFSYADAQPGYRLPEAQPPLLQSISDLSPNSAGNGNCALGSKVGSDGGYTAQPLHGAWAVGPYLHNGSVPTVWDLLKPADRPDVWRRQLVPQSEAAPRGERGFDTVMSRAYDYDKLGWHYDRMSCDARTDVATILSCRIAQQVPTALDLLLTPGKVVADYFSPPYLPPPPGSAAPGADAVSQREIYNTHAFSKSNQGHSFTKVLTDPERKALIEYLKTL